ncbi:single-stranded DNA-binding protein [Candidatus Gracilibacteria bacterium]|nr:single-stranded DNA-binding protein [Candidatus Gracilibacteria bacterium]
MRTVNKVILIGNVTRDPIIKNIESNKKVAFFSIATNRYYKTIEGENKSESEFHNLVAWGSLAERVEKFLTKGKLVYIEGRLKTRVIEKEDQTKSYKTEIVISNLIFLNKKSDFDSIDEEDSFSLDDESDKF